MILSKSSKNRIVIKPLKIPFLPSLTAESNFADIDDQLDVLA